MWEVGFNSLKQYQSSSKAVAFHNLLLLERDSHHISCSCCDRIPQSLVNITLIRKRRDVHSLLWSVPSLWINEDNRHIQTCRMPCRVACIDTRTWNQSWREECIKNDSIQFKTKRKQINTNTYHLNILYQRKYFAHETHSLRKFWLVVTSRCPGIFAGPTLWTKQNSWRRKHITYFTNTHSLFLPLPLSLFLSVFFLIEEISSISKITVWHRVWFLLLVEFEETSPQLNSIQKDAKPTI